MKYKQWLEQELNLQPGYQEVATWIWVEKAWNAALEEAAKMAEEKTWPLSCPLGELVNDIRSLKEE